MVNAIRRIGRNCFPVPTFLSVFSGPLGSEMAGRDRLRHTRSWLYSATMHLLLGSLLALIAGPLLAYFLRHRRAAMAAIDGFVLVSLAGMVALFILPQAITHAGLWALPALALGIFVPGMVENLLHHHPKKHRHHHVVSVLALSGLALHAFTDGAALVEHDHHSGEILGLGVILHRVPLGVIVWLRAKRPAAIALLILIALATLAGFWVGHDSIPFLSQTFAGAFFAFVGGSLLHVALEPAIGTDHHHHGSDKGAKPVSTAEQRLYSGIGGVLALGVLASLMYSHPVDILVPSALGAGDTFFTLALESAPALVLGFGAAGIIQTLLRAKAAGWLRGKNAATQSLRGMAFGLPLPLCSCSVVPVFRSLVRAAAPPSAAFAFLVATPEIGLDAFFLSFSLLGTELAILRVVAAAVVALLVGIVMQKTLPLEQAPETYRETDNRGPFASRLLSGLRFGFGEMFDHTAPWIIVGLIIAAFCEPMLSADNLAKLPPGLDVVLLAVVGMPIYVCASGATPFVAVLLHKGLSAGAAIAFLLTGPATNITTIGIVRSLFGKRSAWLFAITVPLLGIILGLAINFSGISHKTLALHEASEDGPGLLQISCLLFLVLLTLRLLLKQGPRAFIANLGVDASDEDHCHDACS